MAQKVYMIKNEVERPSNTPNTKIGFGNVSFSRTQVRVLEKVGEGFSNLQIAENLCLSRRTIESHIFNIKLILQEHFGYKFCDRELVLFARQMLVDYKAYIKENLRDFTEQYLISNCDVVNYEQELKYLVDTYNLDSNGLDIEDVDPVLESWTPEKNGN